MYQHTLEDDDVNRITALVDALQLSCEPTDEDLATRYIDEDDDEVEYEPSSPLSDAVILSPDVMDDSTATDSGVSLSFFIYTLNLSNKTVHSLRSSSHRLHMQRPQPSRSFATTFRC